LKAKNSEFKSNSKSKPGQGRNSQKGLSPPTASVVIAVYDEKCPKLLCQLQYTERIPIFLRIFLTITPD